MAQSEMKPVMPEHILHSVGSYKMLHHTKDNSSERTVTNCSLNLNVNFIKLHLKNYKKPKTLNVGANM